jgi:hypothetical protein
MILTKIMITVKIKLYVGMEVKLHAFLTPVVGGGEWSSPHACLFTPGKEVPVPTGQHVV